MRLFIVKIPFDEVTDQVFAELLLHLDKESQDRVSRFLLREDAIRSTVGRLLPIWYLRTHLNVSCSLQHGVGPHGKPFIMYEGRKLQYNVSHHGPFVLFGVTDTGGASVGVDVAAVPSEDEYPDLEEALQEALSPTERRALQSSALSVRGKMLAMMWAAKEAYVKALGAGVTFGLQRIDVHVKTDCLVESIEVDGTNMLHQNWIWSSGWLDDYQFAWVAIDRSHTVQQGLEPEHLAWNDLCADLSSLRHDHEE